MQKVKYTLTKFFVITQQNFLMSNTDNKKYWLLGKYEKPSLITL